ncbi:MAG: hypothetical protein II507_13150 [Treponema sp.]|nr:hypothetical protein [Treponema sp.]
MHIEWNNDKNELLKKTRNVCFEQVKEKIAQGDFLGPEQNPSRENQMRIIVKLNDYPYAIPFVIMEDGGWFLKTIYPCRNMKERFSYE